METYPRDYLANMVDANDLGCQSYIEGIVPRINKNRTPVSLLYSSVSSGITVTLSSVDWSRV
jgi:hypothetical protein